MTHATAVIGANFGDEGKGRVVDHLVRSYSDRAVAVIRHNGGAQAGHTVVASGKSHVFHHYGAGTLAGAITFLSEHFIVNPIIWEEERAALEGLMGSRPPHIRVVDEAIMTTPFDMLINQAIEICRSVGRHGSVGIGINETVVRCATDYATTVDDVSDPTALRVMLRLIRDEYMPGRLSTLGIDLPRNLLDIALSEDTIERYMASVAEMAEDSLILPSLAGLPEIYDELIFEGAQGLLLDAHHQYFPYVTRSRTGLINVIDLMVEMKLHELDAIFVTRPYMTRHGAGPFPTEERTMSFQDPTNVPHPFQGTLRHGSLDIDALAERVRLEILKASWSVHVHPIMAVTCLDQIEDRVQVMCGGHWQDYGPHTLVREIAIRTKISSVLTSWGRGDQPMVMTTLITDDARRSA